PAVVRSGSGARIHFSVLGGFAAASGAGAPTHAFVPSEAYKMSNVPCESVVTLSRETCRDDGGRSLGGFWNTEYANQVCMKAVAWFASSVRGLAPGELTVAPTTEMPVSSSGGRAGTVVEVVSA